MPVWFVFIGTIALVIVSIEVGLRLGQLVRRRSEDEKESPVSALTGVVLGFAAFMLAFTFSIVWGRFDSRKALVREDANAIRTAWQRSDFLPESDRAEARALFQQYIETRVAFTEAGSLDREHLNAIRAETQRIQDRLWDMAVVNARKDMNSDVAALYIDSLNTMTAVNVSRVAIGIQARVPWEIWLVLYCITFFGMLGLGYQTGIAESKRSLAWPIIAISFALGIAVIFALDHPDSGILKVPQQPLYELREQVRTKTIK